MITLLTILAIWPILSIPVQWYFKQEIGHYVLWNDKMTKRMFLILLAAGPGTWLLLGMIRLIEKI